MITYLYDAEGRDQQVELTRETLEALADNRLLWVDITGRRTEQLSDVAEILHLDASTLRYLVGPNIGQLENLGRYLQLTVETLPGNGGDNRNGRRVSARLDLLISKNWLVTVRDEPIDFIDSFRNRDPEETLLGALATHDLAASLLDLHLAAFFEEIARIEKIVDGLDEQALTRPSSKTLLGRMVTLRRHVSRLRTMLSRQRKIFYGLSRPDLQIATDAELSPHFRVLSARFERAIDEVEHARDLVVGSFELFESRTALETNELVKALTFLTAVIGLCAAVAGLFGMNFETKFFAAGDIGFYTTIIALSLLTVLAGAIARWKGWL